VKKRTVIQGRQDLLESLSALGALLGGRRSAAPAPERELRPPSGDTYERAAARRRRRRAKRNADVAAGGWRR
jgi:hypothetical protein